MSAPTSVLPRPEDPETADDGSASPRPDSSGSDAWWTRAEVWIGFLVVAACCTFIFIQLEPRLLLRNTTPAGGDTPAHVWWPAYLRDHLLPWRLAGWSPDFYAGFPAGQFYFPVPALLVIAFDGLVPYNVAFKLVTALGPIALPAGAYVFGRGIRAPRPTPEAMAVGATAFLFFVGADGIGDTQNIAFNQHIMGGNLASMLAGEFSFSIALALAFFFLGTFAYTLRTGSRAWLPTVLFAATVMSHLVVAIFVVLAAIVVWLVWRPSSTFKRAAVIGGVGTLLTAVWTVPLLATLGSTTDTRYEPVTEWVDYLFPGYVWAPGGILPWQWGAGILVGIAVVFGRWRRRRSTFALVGMTVVAGLAFRFWEDVQATPAWNLRLLPFWYLMVFLLMAVGAAEAVRAVGKLAARAAEPNQATEGGNTVATRNTVVAGCTAAVLTGLLTIGALVAIDRGKSFLPYWIKWNYSGLEDDGREDVNLAKATTEYRALIDTMSSLPPGRALWEGNAELNVYGSPLALMLLPYWTDGRIASMEGVYYEASGTSPYHFLTAASLFPSQSVSNPIRGLPYRSIAEFATGVERAQTLGVRYLLVHSVEAKQAAQADARLRLVATSPSTDGKPPDEWYVYQVSDSPVVEALTYQPVVVDQLRTGTARECAGSESLDPRFTPDKPEEQLDDWECLAVPWFDDAAALDRPLTDDGPASWQHVSAASARVAPKEKLPAVNVSKVRTTDDSVSFDVSRTGVPVLVKTSYFPNWKVSGAQGPYRATPNFMVVVPTSRHVTLEYATSDAEWLGRFGTLLGVGGLVGLALWSRRRARARPIEWPSQ